MTRYSVPSCGRRHNGGLASLNDEFRRRGHGNGEIVLTPGIRAHGHAFVTRALSEVQAYDGFSLESDPSGHHDFGVVDIDGTRVCFKFDYYDDARVFGSPDPSDPVCTHRVLTLFQPLEY